MTGDAPLRGPAFRVKTEVNASCDRCRNPERDVTALVEFLRPINLEHTRLVLEEGTDDVSGETPELGKLLRFEVTLKGIATCGRRLMDGNRNKL
jgi:hypothetical protein